MSNSDYMIIGIVIGYFTVIVPWAWRRLKKSVNKTGS